LILAIAQLKKVFVHLDKGHKIKKSEFIKRFESKKDEKIIKALFDTDDLMEITDKLFNLLEKNFVIEAKNKDEYLVLNSINYYLDIVDGISEGDIDE
jgi:ABC-type cobalamin/Fe3+-siderophores transport system ATPase subunit